MSQPLTIEFLENKVPSIEWIGVPIWVRDSLGKVKPAQSAWFHEDTSGARVIILSTEPATPEKR